MPIVGSHQQAPVTIPINGTSPIDAQEVRLNDNAIIGNYNDHDGDATIHVQSSPLASRPLAGVAGRLWLVTDDQQLYYDTGTAWVSLKLDASSLTTGTVPAARVAGAYDGITSVGTLDDLNVTGPVVTGSTVNAGGQVTAPSFAGNLTGSVTGNVTGNVTGSAGSAAQLTAAKTFAVTGAVSGSASSDLSGGVSIASSYAGTVPFDKGGTGQTATPTNGQLLIGNGAGYALAQLQAGANTIITNGPGTITITSTGAGTGTTTRTVTVQSATAGQTTFSVTYNPGYIDAYLNGVLLTPGVDYTAANGTTVVLATGAALNDELVFVTYTSLSLAGIINGSGTSNYVPKWQNVNTVTNSQIQDDGTNVGIGTGPDATYKTTTPSLKITGGGLSANNVNYTMPASQGAAGTGLVNDGSGNLSWATTSPASVTITPTLAAPYNVQASDAGKRLVMNSTVTGGVNLDPTGTNSIAVGATVKLASFGAGTVLNPNDGNVERLLVDNFGLNISVSAIALQSDGRVLVGGGFSSGPNWYLFRLNTDGSPDTSFTPTINDTVSCIAVQSDGRILIGGNFTTVNGSTRNRIARLNSDGSLDPTYNPNADSTVNAIVLQSDGQAVVGGAFTTMTGFSRLYLARLSTSGSFDVSYSEADAQVLALAIQSDGKVVVGGTFSTVGGAARSFIARVNTTGTIDSAFNPGTNNWVRALAVQSDKRTARLWSEDRLAPSCRQRATTWRGSTATGRLTQAGTRTQVASSLQCCVLPAARLTG